MRWLLGAIALLIIGIVFQLGLLVYAMYVLLGVMLVSRYLAREWVERITAERECSRLTAQIGDKVAVVVQIKNTGRLPVPWLIVEDSVPKEALVQKPPRISLDGKRIKILQLSGRGTEIAAVSGDVSDAGLLSDRPAARGERRSVRPASPLPTRDEAAFCARVSPRSCRCADMILPRGVRSAKCG